MSDKKEFFSINTKNWDTAIIALKNGGYTDGKDYFLISEKKTGLFGLGGIVKSVSTSNPQIKSILENNGAENEGEVELHVVIPKKNEGILVNLDVSRDKVIAAIEASEGGSKFRHQLDFDVDKKGNEIRIYPVGDNPEKWDELSALLNSEQSPVTLANLKEKPKGKVKG